MEFLLFTLLIVVLIIVIGIRNGQNEKLSRLEERMDALLAEIKKLRSVSTTAASTKEEKSKVETPAVVKPPVPEPPKVEKELERTSEQQFPRLKSVLEQSAAKPQPVKLPIPQPPKPLKPGFFERNPDLEKFIGENLTNKIGIGVLVLGIGFFVKYAIDQNWINEIGRVFIGVVCGGILLGIAHKLRKALAAFSSVLVGGGIAVLYLTIAIAFHEYQIFSQVAAFVIMVCITGLAITFSIAYNRIELAVVSLLGGFASPFMVSTGEGNYIVLFTYILILDGGMLILAYFKRWNLVNIIAYIFTMILFASWLGTRYDYETPGMMAGALTFGTLFYVVFFVMNLINNLKSHTSFNAIEITLILSNTFLYYAAGMTILGNPVANQFQGLFTAALGVFNFGFAYTLYKGSKVDKKLVFLLIGLVLTFISLAAPVQLEGNYITLFWSAEAVLLLWLSQKSGIRLMKLSAVVVMALMVFSLLIDWTQIYGDGANSYLLILLNKGYITSLVSLVAIGMTLYFLKYETVEKAEWVAKYRIILGAAGGVVLYVMHLLELSHQLVYYEVEVHAQHVIIGCYNIFFLLAILVVARNRTAFNERIALTGIGIIGLLSFLFYYHMEVIEARNYYLLESGSGVGFMFHYLLILLLVGVAYLSLRKAQTLTAFNKESLHAYSWFYVFFFVFMASAELDHTVLLFANTSTETISGILTQNHKIGYPILWGLASFLLIFVGLKLKRKQLRIISLTLFLITLIKLFTFDIKDISEGGKIAAFISLGVLLLIVSFMYQRLKKLLLIDEESTSVTENK